jgi:uncharacterized protein YkwD
MTRVITLLGLILLAAGTPGLSGCKPTVPGADPPKAVLDAEQGTLDLINGERAAAGLSALVMDEDARKVARAHSEDMVARGFFSHTNPDGLDPFQRIDAAGIPYVSAGENLAWNNAPAPAESAVTGWMASPPHRANILRPQFDRTGMGVAVKGLGTYYFTQVFIGTVAKSGEQTVFYDELVVGEPQE